MAFPTLYWIDRDNFIQFPLRYENIKNWLFDNFEIDFLIFKCFGKQCRPLSMAQWDRTDYDIASVINDRWRELTFVTEFS